MKYNGFFNLYRCDLKAIAYYKKMLLDHLTLTLTYDYYC